MVAFYKSIRRDDHSPPRPIFIESTSQHSNIPNRNVRTIGIPRRKVGNILASKNTLSLGLQPFQKACQEMFGPPEQPPQNLQLRCHESLWIPTMGTKQHDFEGNIQNGKLGMVFLAHSTYNRTLVLCCVRTILYPVESWQHTDPLLSRWDAHLEKQWPLRWHFAVFDLGNIGDEIQLARARYIGITIKTIIRIPRKTTCI